ncbi:hypothetical protein HMN09_01327400 [Mycena chlorophos]|uniref:F-box domain-containing protein n=1 Tax=Mycena chlorophos TaxID=658473 RepID=A0A8H6RZV7_MYCCL|nr:hypothetical protein HMN09_01327400 [Mycena chlorophos]
MQGETLMLPVPIWVQIFQHIFNHPSWRHMPAERLAVLCQLSLVCRIFRLATDNIIFSELRCSDTYKDTTLYSPNSLYSQRLDFWRTPSIGQFVRRCAISKTTNLALFDILPCLPQLRELELIGIPHLGPEHLMFICGLEALVWLYVFQCRTRRLELQLPDGAVRWKISHAEFFTGIYAEPLLYPLLLPAYLTEFDATGGVDRLFSPRGVRDMPIFPRVKKLHIDWVHHRHDGDPERLLNFPAVEDLVLTGPMFLTPEFHSALFPKLKRYRGPFRNLRYFAAVAELENLSIWGEDPSKVIPRHRDEDSSTSTDLQEFSYPQPNALQILSATFDVLTGPLVRDFMAQWPKLTQLSIRYYCASGNPGDKHCAETFFNDFFPVLPSSLERLALRWQCYVPHNIFAPGESITSVSPTLLDELLEEFRCPRLRAVWLEGCEYLLRWRKSLQEPPVCIKIHYNSEVAQEKRDEFDAWWEDTS